MTALFDADDFEPDPHATFADAWLDETEGHAPLARWLPARPLRHVSSAEQRSFFEDPDEAHDAERNGDLDR